MAWSYVTSAAGIDGSTTNSQTVSVSVSAGNLIAVCIFCASGGLPVSSVSDTVNTYNYLGDKSESSGSGAWYWAQALTTASLTITVSYPSAVFQYVAVDIYSVASGSTISVPSFSGANPAIGGGASTTTITTPNISYSTPGNPLSWAGGGSSNNSTNVTVSSPFTTAYQNHSSAGDITTAYNLSPSSPSSATFTQANNTKNMSGINVLFIETLAASGLLACPRVIRPSDLPFWM